MTPLPEPVTPVSSWFGWWCISEKSQLTNDNYKLVMFAYLFLGLVE